MKKLLLISTAFALVLGLSQCKKPNMPTINSDSGATQDVVLSAVIDDGDSKVVEDGMGGLRWSVGDLIAVRKKGVIIGTLVCQDENGTFVGRIQRTIGSIQFTFGDEKSLINQTGDIYYALSHTSGDVEYNHDGNYNVTMTMPHAVLKLDLSSLGTPDGNEVTISKGGTIIASVANVTNEANKPYYVAMPGAGKTEYTFIGNGKIANKTWTLKKNVFYTKSGAPGESIVIDGEPLWDASVVTIPVCAIHAKCASSGGVVTGTGVEEQGVCWGKSANPTISGSHYVHQYEYAPGVLTPKESTTNNTFTGFMSNLTAGTKYHVRAYIKKGTQVIYGDDITFTTLASEPVLETVNFGTPNLNWAKYNLGVNPTNLDEAADWCGDYYQWGDCAACTGTTEGRSVNCNGWQAYRFARRGDVAFTKYSNLNPVIDNKTSLEYVDDCVRQTLGGSWRIPTPAEWQSLCDNNTVVWVAANETYTGVNPDFTAPVAGRLVIKGTTPEPEESVYMFLPVTNRRENSGFANKPNSGYYCSNSVNSAYNKWNFVLCMAFSEHYLGPQAGCYVYRNRGIPVRPVK